MSAKPILVIAEDDLFLVEAMQNKFRSVGFDVHVAPNGYAALKILETLIPNVMLLDIRLPQKDGFDILAEIKANEKWKDIPIIIASNVDGEKDIHRGYELGAGDYVVKSNISLNSLVQRVTYLMNMSKSHKKTLQTSHLHL